MKSKKKKRFLIEYFFDGNGEVVIEADSKEDAIEKWHDGDFSSDEENEWGERYEVIDVREEKSI